MKKMMALLVAAVLFFPSECLASTASSKEIKPVLKKVGKRLSLWLSALDDDLQSASRLLSTQDFNSAEARDVLKGLCIGRSYVIDAVIMDKTGHTIAVRTPGDRLLDEKSLRAQEDAVQVEVTRKPAMSCEFRLAGNDYVIVFEYPIFDEDGIYLGSLSLLVDQEDYLSNIIKPIIREAPCGIWMMQTDGNVVYTDYPEFMGKNFFKDDIFKPMKTLCDFAKKVAAKKTGEGSYEYYAPGDDKEVIKDNAVWDTVGLYDSYWRVVAVDRVVQ